MARVAFFMVPFVYEGGVGRGVGRGSDLLLNAVLFVPKWSGLSSPLLNSFGKLGVDFVLFRAFTQTWQMRKEASYTSLKKNALKVAVISYTKQTMGGFPQDDDFY